MASKKYTSKYQARKSSSGSATAEVAPEQALKASIDESAEALLAALQAGKSEALVKYLEFAGRFHKYSLGNQLLILLQCENASMVAGYQTWATMPHKGHNDGEGQACKERGYHVAKGQKAIRILAPRTWKKTDEESGEESTHLYFRSVAVFDVSQLVQEELAEHPLPDFFQDMGHGEDAAELAEDLIKAATAAGLQVIEKPASQMDGAEGRASEGKRIELRQGLPAVNKAAVMAHEWAHILLHQGAANADRRKQTTRTIRECHAEATSFIVCAHFGITNTLSADYLQMWGNTAADLMAELAMVREAASFIIATIEKMNGSEDATQEPQSIE